MTGAVIVFGPLAEGTRERRYSFPLHDAPPGTLLEWIHGEPLTLPDGRVVQPAAISCEHYRRPEIVVECEDGTTLGCTVASDFRIVDHVDELPEVEYDDDPEGVRVRFAGALHRIADRIGGGS